MSNYQRNTVYVEYCKDIKLLMIRPSPSSPSEKFDQLWTLLTLFSNSDQLNNKFWVSILLWKYKQNRNKTNFGQNKNCFNFKSCYSALPWPPPIKECLFNAGFHIYRTQELSQKLINTFHQTLIQRRSNV